jgi:hypothetical protein
MLQDFFKYMLRMTGHKAAHPANLRPRLPAAEAYAEVVLIAPEFLTQTLRPTRTSILIQSRGDRAMQQSPDDPTSKPGSEDTQQPDGTVVRFPPRRRPEPQRRPEPTMPDDDDDPGPSAA